MTEPIPGQAELGLGCWAFGGGYWLNQQRSDSVKSIHAAVRLGIRHFDTAQGYGKGLSEQIMGQQLRRFRRVAEREDLTIATKLYLPRTPSDIAGSVAVSLRRLCTPYIDILYIHWPDSSKDCRPYLEEMEKLRQTGLVRRVGVANFTLPLLEQAAEAADIGWCQLPVSLLWRRSLDTLGPFCRSRNIRMAGYSPLGLGLLSGRYHSPEDLDPSDKRRQLFPFLNLYRASFHNLLDTLAAEASAYGTDVPTLALAWALSREVAVILTGSRSKEQLISNSRARGIAIGKETLLRLEAVSGEIEALLPSEANNPFFHRW